MINPTTFNSMNHADNAVFVKNSITTHSGKMSGIPSINTSALCNSICEQRRKDSDTVCANCYACNYLSYRKTLREKCERNHVFYTTKALSKEDIPTINNKYFRFESFGELENVQQLANYNEIAWYNSDTLFTLWTKNMHIVREFLAVECIADNLHIIASSRFVNVSDMEYYKKNYSGMFNAVFTVYTKEYASKNNININCGSKNCLDCLLCYRDVNWDYDPFEINEILK